MSSLESYLAATNQTAFGFAKRLGRSPSTITRAIKGERNPSIKLARQIQDATGGVVTAQQFLSDCIMAESRREAQP